MAREISFTERRGAGVLWEQIREYIGRTPEIGVLIGFFAVFLFFIVGTSIQVAPDGTTTFRSPQILTPDSISSVVTNATSQGILAVGITVLMISGEFDLSVGSTLGLTALIFIIAADSGLGGLVGMFLSDETVRSLGISFAPLPGLVAVLVALCSGALLGLVNGLLLIWTRIPSFIVTLGTLYLYRSIMLNIIPGGTIARYLQPPIIAQFHPLVIILFSIGLVAVIAFFSRPAIQYNLSRLRQNGGGVKIGPVIRLLLIAAVLVAGVILAIQSIISYIGDLNRLIEVPFFTILNGRLEFLPGNFRASIVWWFILAGIFTVIMNQTRYGNAVFAVGGNPGAARAQGVNVNRVKVLNFMLSGTMAAVGGIMEAARFEVVEPLRGQGYELDVIAAAVIGGTLLSGGYGSIVGALLGVLLSGMLKTGLVLIGVDASWFRGVLGVIMIAAVIINTNVRRQR